jgi:hypothetical protein
MNDDPQRVLLDYLAGEKASFVQDVLRSPSLRQQAPYLEDALRVLEHDGAVLVRPHSCGDPHLEGADLRIVALVPRETSSEDPLAAALAAIDHTWDNWLASFLADHRCT